jgi:AAA domain
VLKVNVVSVGLGATDMPITTVDGEGIAVCPAEAAALPIPTEIRRHDALIKHRLLQPGEVDRICAQEHRNGGLVTGLIARRSVSVLIGDSGLGKSPLAYQLGLCVAEGLPFLGMDTERGTVVYADYENGLEESQALRERLVKFLGLSKAPNDFLIWTPASGSSLHIADVCRDVKPALLIVDSLRSHDPTFEKTDNAGQGMSSLRSAAYKYGVALFAIHHVRKPGPDGVPSLDSDETVLMHWFNQASGHRSIINQSDSRIAAGLPKPTHDAAMILRWQRRLKGERGPLYVERVCNEEGEPIGYKPLVGAKLLNNQDQETAFGRLPQGFTFKEAKQIYGRTDDPTRKWLLKCECQGLIEQLGRGHYQRLV